ncbi:homoprotocatechuate degradation operon regulator HpaR [Limnobaculum zhutongyuii]|uniref:Homoprotocatechuate degradation operon regulator HpaR n=1 Tax=Limnobaculum zhutongyuii TaxID=2498113 RepID=A0A411WGU8_9GAMM|nr:homoprotocatechuate degradation operon regulator HpaR [Limnobaculum zhutongyuii]QBH95521.1 homoprotocatechuate degradation operon regulator HpaR [Limnobaculum zhutongyuii]TQS88789.1 homoprotocatechuate degradation operon regulator HpaR [Limnobaculum zhutongyuii]
MHESLTIALLQAREAAMGFFRPILNEYNLTEQQWRIIRVLAEMHSCDFHLLAKQTCILRPSLTGILSRMERDGLIIRLKPLNDQRKLYVSLTDKGHQVYQQAKQHIEKGYRQIESSFSEEKLGELMVLLERFIAVVDNGNSEQVAEKSVN